MRRADGRGTRTLRTPTFSGPGSFRQSYHRPVNEIDALIERVNKKHPGVLRYASTLQTFQRVGTGSLAYDLALGGGWPLNVWNEIVGLESHGKTVMAMKTLAAQMQRDPDYKALWVASEDFNAEWARTLGVDTNRVVLAATNVMEEAYTIMVEGLDSQLFDAVVLDSYPALVPTAENEAAIEEWQVGIGARLTNKLMRVSTPAMRREPDERNCLCIIINQWRDKIGGFGDPRTTPGGRGKNFSFFSRVEVVRDGWVERNKVKVGQTMKIRTMKNKTAPPSRVAVTDFYFDNASPFQAGDYDTVAEVWNIATTYDVITRAGAWYHYGGQKWNGKDPVLQSLREDLDLRREVDTEVRKLVLAGVSTPPQPVASVPTKQRRRKKA
jgi:recombination protein RecA